MVVALWCGNLVRVEGTMDGHKYHRIMRENLIQSGMNLQLERRFIFQHDNDPKYKVKVTLEWAKNRKVTESKP